MRAGFRVSKTVTVVLVLAGCVSPIGPVDAGRGDAGTDTLCAADEHVVSHVCTACPEGSTNAAGDAANGDDTACDANACPSNQHVANHVCMACAAGTTRAAGDLPTSADTSCNATRCGADQHVASHACVACAAGSVNSADDDASGSDTSCDAVLCGVDEHVSGHACLACEAGATNLAGDDATGADTLCDATDCPSNQHVVSHACIACAPGSTNAAGDDATGADTSCDATLCSANQHVSGNACVACATGSTNPAGNDASGADTVCSATLCGTDEHVAGHVCVACPAGASNLAGDDASSVDTQCDATACPSNQHVVSHACVACAPGSTNPAGDDATGADTSCTATLCGVSEHVVGHVCLGCPSATTNPAGNDATGADTSCTDCITGCGTCVGTADNCTACRTGYFLFNGICQSTICADNFHVVNHQCVACPTGLTRTWGDDTANGDTACADTIAPTAIIEPGATNAMLSPDGVVRFIFSEAIAGAPNTVPVLQGTLASSGTAQWEGNTLVIVPNGTWPLITASLSVTVQDLAGNSAVIGLDGYVMDAIYVDTLIGSDSAYGTFDTPLRTVMGGIARAASFGPGFPVKVVIHAGDNAANRQLAATTFTDVDVSCLADEGVFPQLSLTGVAQLVSTTGHQSRIKGCFVSANANGGISVSGNAIFSDARVTAVTVQPSATLVVQSAHTDSVAAIASNYDYAAGPTSTNPQLFLGKITVNQGTLDIENVLAGTITATDSVVTISNGGSVDGMMVTQGTLDFDHGAVGWQNATSAGGRGIALRNPSSVPPYVIGNVSFFTGSDNLMAVIDSEPLENNYEPVSVTVHDSHFFLGQGMAFSSFAAYSDITFTDNDIARVRPGNSQYVVYAGYCGNAVIARNRIKEVPIYSSSYGIYVDAVSGGVYDNIVIDAPTGIAVYDSYLTWTGEPTSYFPVVGNTVDATGSSVEVGNVALEHNVLISRQGASFIPVQIIWDDTKPIVLTRWNVFSAPRYYVSPTDMFGVEFDDSTNLTLSHLNLDDAKRPTAATPCLAVRTAALASDVPSIASFPADVAGISRTLPYSAGAYESDGACACGLNEHVVNGACVACASGTNANGDDITGGDTACDGMLCAVNMYVSGQSCVACPAGSTNAAGDDAAGADTQCDVTLCAVNEHVVGHQCSACAAGSSNAAGDDASGADTACDSTSCAQNEYVSGHACVACTSGVNAAGDDPMGADTSCDTNCPADTHVSNHVCVACAAGTTRAAGDAMSGSDTTCQPVSCLANQRVLNHRCVACLAGTERAAGDVATGADTSCVAVICAQNENVVAHTCVACADGSTRPAGDSAAGPATTCATATCAVNQHVVGHQCVACNSGDTRPAGDDPTGADTSCACPTCGATYCSVDTHVVDHVCVSCVIGTARPAGDDASGADTSCSAIHCAANQRVSGHVCIACEPGQTNDSGDDATGADTACDHVLCAVNQHVAGHACVACGAGSSRHAGDDAALADTTCETQCLVNQQVVNGLCEACAPGMTNAAGDLVSAVNTDCDHTLCSNTQNVQNHQCVECVNSNGRVNWTGRADDASGANTTCIAKNCGTNEYVSSWQCVACIPGSTNPAGDPVSGSDTSCTHTICNAQQGVSNHQCYACYTGYWTGHTSDATGAAVNCAPWVCATNEHIVNSTCVACPAGTTNIAGDNASTSTDSLCDPTVCAPTQYVSSNQCVACPACKLAGGNAANGTEYSCGGPLPTHYKDLVLSESPLIKYFPFDEVPNLPGHPVTVCSTDYLYCKQFSDYNVGQPGLVTPGNTLLGGYAYTFDGAQNLSFDWGAQPVNSPDYAVEFWVRSSPGQFSPGALYPVLSLKPAPLSDGGVASYRGYAFYVNTNDHNRLELWTGNGSGWNVLKGPFLTSGATYHVFANIGFNPLAQFYQTWNGAGYIPGYTARLFVNGVDVARGDYASPTTTTILGSYFDGTTQLTVGPFEGQVDDVAFYRGYTNTNHSVPVLSPAEIHAHFVTGIARGIDLSCTACPANMRVYDHICVDCPLYYMRAAGDPLSGGDTTCVIGVCSANEHISNHQCVPCDPGMTHPAGDLMSGGDTVCRYIVCAADERVSSNACVACPAGTYAGGFVNGPDTTCGSDDYYDALVLSDSPTAYWKLDETAAPAVDVVAGSAAVLHDTVTFSAESIAPAGTAVSFTGNGYLEAPYNGAQNPVGDYSVEFWMRPNGVGGGFQSPVCSRSGAIFGFNFYIEPSSLLSFSVGGGGAHWITVYNPSVMVAGTNYHVVGTYNVASQTQALYVNGALVASQTGVVALANPDVSLRIGAGATDGPSGLYRFNGTVDNVAVYGHTLTGNEVLEHYTYGSPGH